MEFNLIKEPIQKSIRYAQTLINQFNEENPKKIIFEETQIKFYFKKGMINTGDTSHFIAKYRVLYERSQNAFQKLFIKNDTLKPVLLYAEKINSHLSNLDNCLEKFQPNVFNKGFNGIRNEKEKYDELKTFISDNLKKFKEEKEKYIKEFKRRNLEILNIVNSYLYLLIKLIKNIKKLSETLKSGFKLFNESEDKFRKEIDIKDGKSGILQDYRQIAILVGEINNIFLIADKTEKKRTTQSLNKLSNLDDNLKKYHKIIYEQINQIREKYNFPKVDLTILSLGYEEIDTINEDCSDLAKELNNIFEKYKESFNEIKILENELRIDLLFIMDTTSSMGYYLDKFKLQFLKIIQNIQSKCNDSLIFVGFIGYKDIFDKELGDEYLDYDFTLNYEKLNNKIEEIEPDGGIDIPEDIPGAFELALAKINKTWTGNNKFAILITDSPCHGVDFHNLNQKNDEQKDEYPEGDPDGKNIREMIKKFVKNKISLFCANLNKNTSKMFKIFAKEYEKLKPPDANYEFLVEKGLFANKFVEKIKAIFNGHLGKLIKKHVEKQKNNKNNLKINNNNENNLSSDNNF